MKVFFFTDGIVWRQMSLIVLELHPNFFTHKWLRVFYACNLGGFGVGCYCRMTIGLNHENHENHEMTRIKIDKMRTDL